MVFIMHKRLIALMVCDFMDYSRVNGSDKWFEDCYLDFSQAVRDSVFVFGFMNVQFIRDRLVGGVIQEVDEGSDTDLFTVLAKYVLVIGEDASRSEQHSRLFLVGLVKIADSFGLSNVSYKINKALAGSFIPS